MANVFNIYYSHVDAVSGSQLGPVKSRLSVIRALGLRNVSLLSSFLPAPAPANQVLGEEAHRERVGVGVRIRHPASRTVRWRMRDG